MTFFLKHKTRFIIFLIALVGLIQFFQNCSNSSYSLQYLMDQLNKNQTFGPNGEVRVEGGEYTNDMTVYIQPETDPSVTDIAITNNPNCANNTSWQPLQNRIPWTLSTPNVENYFWVQFKNNTGTISDCIKAHVTHDDQAPQITIVNRPAPFTSRTDETIRFAAQDDGSGVYSLLCKIEDETLFKTCENAIDLHQLQDGPHRVSVGAIDLAGNISAPIDIEWTIDTVSPIVRFTRFPDRVVNQVQTPVEFEGSDNPNGSGVDFFECQMNGFEWKACTSPLLLSALNDGDYQLSVRAQDHAGNISDPDTVRWTLDQTAPQKFSILGVSGQNDQVIDSYLSLSATPDIHWSAAAGANIYQVEIRNASELPIKGCQGSTTSSIHYLFNNQTPP